MNPINRRNVLKGAAGVTAAGMGAAVFTGSAAADMTVETSESGDGETVTVQTDDGDVSEVSISPTLDVSWEGFDEPAEEIRFLVEAKRADQPDSAFVPVLRETPWLYTEDVWPESEHSAGTSSSFTAPIFSRASDFVAEGTDFTQGEPAEVPRIVLYTDDYAVPDYAASHEDGTSIGDLSQYSYADQLVNGKYGVAGATDAFDEDADGTSSTTDVTVRYTVSLHTKEEYSPLVMSGEGDEYADLLPEGTEAYNLTHAQTRAIASEHPAVEVVTDTFTVEAQNIQSTTDGTVETNANAE